MNGARPECSAREIFVEDEAEREGTMKSVTIGGAMVDSIAIIDDTRIEHMSMRNAQSSFLLLESGRKVEAVEISQHCGGGAVNAAVSMARLGLDVATVVKLGQDERAELIMRRLMDEGVSTRWVMRDPTSATGAAVIISSHERDAAIFTFRGANTKLRCEDLKRDMFAADLVYVTSLSNESADCFPAIVAMAKEAGAKVATNPGIRQLTSRTASFQTALQDIDLLSLNTAEASALVPALVARFGEDTNPFEGLHRDGTPELCIRGLSSGGYEMSLKAYMAALLQCGVKTVLVTNGMDGAYAACEGCVYHCPVLKTQVAGTAGAGDAFASTFATVLLRDGAPERALQAATINAASVVGHADTQSGLLKAQELDERIEKYADVLSITCWQL